MCMFVYMWGHTCVHKQVCVHMHMCAHVYGGLRGGIGYFSQSPFTLLRQGILANPEVTDSNLSS